MPTTFANTIDGNEILAKRAECDYAGNDLQTTYSTKSEVTTGLASKEDSANKAQSINTSSTTDYPSSKATADFVNSSVATNTAKFLGNFTLTDLSLTYPATDAQIETALDGYTFSPAPTNNDYVYVEIQDPQTPGVTDVVKRFKFDGSNWLYEYSLNNSSFTAAEIAAIDSGVTSTKVGNYDTHIADTTIHVTSTDKTTWDGKQDAISDLNTIRTGAGLGATAVQPGDLATVATSGLYSDLSGTPSLATVATSGDYDDLLNKPTIPAAQVQSDWTEADNTDPSYIQNKPTLSTVATSGAYSDLVGTPTIRNVPPVTSSDDDKVLKASYTGGVGSYSWEQESGGTVTDVEVDGTSVVSGGVASITMPTELVPTVTSSDDGKVLKASYSGGAGSYSWETESGGGGTQADWTEDDPTDPSYIENKPTPKTLTAGTGISITENSSTITVSCNVTAPVQDVTVDGTSVVSNGVAAITSPTVDQTYSSSSTNAQSGAAVAGALSTLGTWEDVSTEAQYNTAIILAGGFQIKYNAMLKLVSVTADVNIDAGAANIFTWSNRLKPVATAFALGNGLNLYVSQTSLNQPAAATNRWVNGVWMWPVVGE